MTEWRGRHISAVSVKWTALGPLPRHCDTQGYPCCVLPAGVCSMETWCLSLGSPIHHTTAARGPPETGIRLHQPHGNQTRTPQADTQASRHDFLSIYPHVSQIQEWHSPSCLHLGRRSHNIAYTGARSQCSFSSLCQQSRKKVFLFYVAQ